VMPEHIRRPQPPGIRLPRPLRRAQVLGMKFWVAQAVLVALEVLKETAGFR